MQPRTGKLLSRSKTKTKIRNGISPTVTTELGRNVGKKWARGAIDYNMHDLFILSCRIIKCLMHVTRHSRSCDYQGAAETLRRQVWAQPPHKEEANPPYRTTERPATSWLLFQLTEMVNCHLGSNDLVHLRLALHIRSGSVTEFRGTSARVRQKDKCRQKWKMSLIPDRVDRKSAAIKV